MTQTSTTLPWGIPKLWEGESVLIIGGGPSLEGFDWEPFHRWNVIGCNDAYLLGDWVDVVISGDKDWMGYHSCQRLYKTFRGLKVTLAPEGGWKDSGDTSRTPRRVLKGMTEDPTELGWNDSTGAAAIALAVKMGACQIVLLGFDMRLAYDEERGWRNNWHNNNLDVPNPDTFKRHINGLRRVKEYVDKFHPKVEILNAGPDSAVDFWPSVYIGEFEKEGASCTA